MDFSDPGKFLFLAGDPALDLLNTTPVLASGQVELLQTFPDLAEWMARAGMLDPGEARELVRHDGPKARTVVEQVRSLREALRGVVIAIEQGGVIPKKQLGEINLALRKGAAHWQLDWRSEASCFQKLSVPEGDDLLSRTIGPVAQSIVALLADKDLSRIRKCENPRCVLHYYDTSKNHSRRWCSMDICGNRMKVAAHYRRQKESS